MWEKKGWKSLPVIPSSPKQTRLFYLLFNSLVQLTEISKSMSNEIFIHLLTNSAGILRHKIITLVNSKVKMFLQFYYFINLSCDSGFK